MARVAEATCATCHHIKPRTEMREVAVNRQTGSRFGLSHSRNNNRQSASVSYSRRHVWVCRGCRAPKSDGILPWRFLLIVGLAAAGIWIYSNMALLVRGPAAVSALGGTSGSVTRSISDTIAPVTALVSGPSDEKTVVTEGVDWNATEIVEAITKALDKGKPRSWKADGYKGQAVVSSPTIDGDRECRNVYVTAKRKGVSDQSPTDTYCRSGDGAWAKD